MRDSTLTSHPNSDRPSSSDRTSSRESPLQRAQSRRGLAVRRATAQPSARGGSTAPTSRVAAQSAGRSRATASEAPADLRPLTSDDERTLKEILSEPVDYIDSPEFHQPDAETRIYGAAEIERPDVTWYRPLMDDFISARLRGARNPKSQTTILLTGAQERILFLKYNFARFSISEIQKQSASRALTLEEARTILRWHGVATQYREQLAETNLALVLAMAKRVRLAELDFADLISEGNMALMRSVDKFDCGRGFKFSTYACRAILKAFSRHGIKVSTHRKRFGAEYDPAFEKSDHLERVRATHERECADEVKHIVLSNKADLSDIELKVIGHRYGLEDALGLGEGGFPAPAAMASLAEPKTPAAEPLTLEQVGQVIGVTKERVRQIQNKALEKIRLALESANPQASAELVADLRERGIRPAVQAN